MSSGDNSPGLSKLAGVINGLILRHKDTALLLDFGTIQDDLSLLTNTFPYPIKAKDYLVCRHLRKIPDDEIPSTMDASVGDHGTHSHRYQPHEILRPNDRVLVAWVQNDAVVIDVIMEAEDVLS